MKRFLSFMFGAVLLLASASVSMAATGTLTWSPNTEDDLEGYEVFQSTVAGQYGPTPIATIPKGTHTYAVILPDPLVDTPYFFVLKAYDFAGNRSTPSNEVTKLIVATKRPDSGVITAGVSTQTSITVLFPVVLDGTGQPAKVNVRYSVSPLNWGSAPSAACTASPCVIPGLTPGVAYQVQAIWYRAGTPNVFGGFSAILDLKTLPLDIPIDLPPAPPKGLIVASISEEKIIVVASRTDCPRLVTSTKGSTATQLVRTVTCVQ